MMRTIPRVVELCTPTRTKLRVLALLVAALALYRLSITSANDLALLAAALLTFALSPLTAERRVIYEVEHVRTRSVVTLVRSYRPTRRTRVTAHAQRVSRPKTMHALSDDERKARALVASNKGMSLADARALVQLAAAQQHRMHASSRAESLTAR